MLLGLADTETSDLKSDEDEDKLWMKKKYSQMNKNNKLFIFDTSVLGLVFYLYIMPHIVIRLKPLRESFEWDEIHSRFREYPWSHPSTNSQPQMCPNHVALMLEVPSYVKVWIAKTEIMADSNDCLWADLTVMTY